MLSLRCSQQQFVAACLCCVPVMLLLLMLLLFAWTSSLTCSPASLPADRRYRHQPTSEGFNQCSFIFLSLACGENEERACVSCVQPTCWEPYIEEIQSCPDKFISQCQLGCNCKFGYLRHDESSKCVLAVDCQFIKRRRFKPIRFV